MKCYNVILVQWGCIMTTDEPMSAHDADELVRQLQAKGISCYKRAVDIYE